MDWRRAKSVLIFAFLCLNLILAYQLWTDRFSQTALNRDMADVEAETMQFLANKDIQVVSDIPRATPRLSTINVRFLDAYRTPMEVILDEPIGFINLLSRSTFRDIEAGTALRYFDAYQLDMSASSSEEFVFYQVHEDLPMFDVILRIFVDEGEITGFKQSFVEVNLEVEEDEVDSQQIISAYTAIRTLAENYLNEGSIITDIKLGYHGQLYDSEDQTFVPNWRIYLSDGAPYYVHAFTGAVEAIQP